MNEASRRYAAVSGGFVATVLLVVLVLSLIVGAGEGIQYTLDSLAYGSLFAVMALGLALLFKVMGLMNFAYGELIMAGAYVMYFTRSWGWLGMILMTVLVVTILSLLMELIAFRPVRDASPVVLLVTSFAVSYGIQQLAWTDVFGLAHRFDSTIGTGPQKGVEPYPWLTNQFDVGGVLVSRLEIATFIVTGVLLVGLTLLLKKTTLGIQLRASSEDFRMAQLTGVRANWVISAAFGITGVLAGAVAILYILRTGAPWAELPREYGSPVTCWRRLAEWEASGVWERVWATLLATLTTRERLIWAGAVGNLRRAPRRRTRRKAS